MAYMVNEMGREEKCGLLLSISNIEKHWNRVSYELKTTSMSLTCETIRDTRFESLSINITS